MLPAAGTTSFAALQPALSEKRPERLHLYLFDLLRLEGRDLRETPLLERKIPPLTHADRVLYEGMRPPELTKLDLARAVATDMVRREPGS